MPYNPHVIKAHPRDPATAQRLVDIDRRLRKVEGQYGIIGVGATITGANWASADSGSRVVVQGPSGTNVPVLGVGMFAVDSSGGVDTVVVAIRPAIGIQIQAASPAREAWAGINWFVPGAAGGGFISVINEGANYSFMDISVESPSTGAGAGILLNANDFAPSIVFTIDATSVTFSPSGFVVPVATTINSSLVVQGGLVGEAALEVFGGIGVFGRTPPAFQPGTPSTLGQVIATMQAYGLCA